MTAKKFDQGKPPVHLIPPNAILEEAKVWAYGATKYGTYNWKKGMEWSRVISAVLRHSFAWHSGETNDPETGLSHLAHIRCCAAMLMNYQENGLGVDDRFGSIVYGPTQPKPEEPSQS